jgi:hypothetical protein
MPSGMDYEVRASVVPGHLRLTWAVAPGACSALSATGAPVTRIVASATPPLSGNWQLFSLRVPRGRADQPLALVGHARDATAPRACADLPVAEARRREPLAGVPPAAARFVAADGAAVAGTVRLWATPSGDLLLRAELGGPPQALNWHVIEGTCGAWRHPDAWSGSPPLVTDPRGQVTAVRPDGTEERRPQRRGARVLARPAGGAEMAVVVPAEWLGWTAEQDLSVQAFVNEGGRGRLVACGDLPVREVLGTAALSSRLPRSGAPRPGLSGLAAGLSLLVAGVALRARLARWRPRRGRPCTGTVWGKE